jgi:hypothetical protein
MASSKESKLLLGMTASYSAFSTKGTKKAISSPSAMTVSTLYSFSRIMINRLKAYAN